MNFIPYSRQNISGEDIAAVSEVLRSDYLTQGLVIPRFEQMFAQVHQVKHAIESASWLLTSDSHGRPALAALASATTPFHS